MKLIVFRKPLEERGVPKELIERIASALESAWRAACELNPELGNMAMTMWPDVDDSGLVHVSVGPEGRHGRSSAPTPEELGERLAADLKKRFGGH